MRASSRNPPLTRFSRNSSASPRPPLGTRTPAGAKARKARDRMAARHTDPGYRLEPLPRCDAAERDPRRVCRAGGACAIRRGAPAKMTQRTPGRRFLCPGGGIPAKCCIGGYRSSARPRAPLLRLKFRVGAMAVAIRTLHLRALDPYGRGECRRNKALPRRLPIRTWRCTTSKDDSACSCVR